jgi:hypothetical protein
MVSLPVALRKELRRKKWRRLPQTVHLIELRYRCKGSALRAPLIAKAIVDQVVRFGRREQYDDITVVVAKKIA